MPSFSRLPALSRLQYHQTMLIISGVLLVLASAVLVLSWVTFSTNTATLTPAQTVAEQKAQTS